MMHAASVSAPAGGVLLGTQSPEYGLQNRPGQSLALVQKKMQVPDVAPVVVLIRHQFACGHCELIMHAFVHAPATHTGSTEGQSLAVVHAATHSIPAPASGAEERHRRPDRQSESHRHAVWRPPGVIGARQPVSLDASS
jgi:hypothetical protein